MNEWDTRDSRPVLGHNAVLVMRAAFAWGLGVRRVLYRGPRPEGEASFLVLRFFFTGTLRRIANARAETKKVVTHSVRIFLSTNKKKRGRVPRATSGFGLCVSAPDTQTEPTLNPGEFGPGMLVVSDRSQMPIDLEVFSDAKRIGRCPNADAPTPPAVFPGCTQPVASPKALREAPQDAPTRT